MTGIIPLAAGFLAGAAGGMGLGGGFVLMLYLSWTGLSVPEARAANLIFFIPTALVSVLMNRRSGLIDTSVIPYAAAAGSIGAVIGLLAAESLDPVLLRKIFAVLIGAVGVRELFHRKAGAHEPEKKTPAAART